MKLGDSNAKTGPFPLYRTAFTVFFAAFVVLVVLASGPVFAQNSETGSLDITNFSFLPNALIACIFALLMLIAAAGTLYWRFFSVMKVKRVLSKLRADRIIADHLFTQNERQFRAILDNASDGIFILDKSGAVESFGQAAGQMFGYQPREMERRSFFVLLPEDEATAYNSDIHQYGKSGEGQFIGAGPREILGKRRDGSTFPMQLSISPIVHDTAGRFVGVVRDLTESMEAQRQLDEKSDHLNQALSDLPQGLPQGKTKTRKKKPSSAKTSGSVSTPQAEPPRNGASIEIEPTAIQGKILLVEDDAEVRDTTTAMLSGAGYDVIAVQDGPTALEAMEADNQEQFVLLVTDIILTGPMNGVEVAQNLKSRFPMLKILFISGYADEGIVASRRNVKDSAFLQKPFVMNDLLKSTAEMISQEIH